MQSNRILHTQARIRWNYTFHYDMYSKISWAWHNLTFKRRNYYTFGLVYVYFKWKNEVILHQYLQNKTFMDKTKRCQLRNFYSVKISLSSLRRGICPQDQSVWWWWWHKHNVTGDTMLMDNVLHQSQSFSNPGAVTWLNTDNPSQFAIH